MLCSRTVVVGVGGVVVAADVALAVVVVVGVGTAEPFLAVIGDGTARLREIGGFRCWQIEV